MTSNNQTPSDKSVQPVMCTLIEKDKRTQMLEWGDIAPLTTSTQRLENGVVLEFDADIAEKVVDLAQREAGCCGTWLSISTLVSEDKVRLEVTTDNPEGLDILNTMLGLSKW